MPVRDNVTWRQVQKSQTGWDRRLVRVIRAGVYSPSRNRHALPYQHESPYGFMEGAQKLTPELSV